MNKATVDLVTSFEGFVGSWYPDPVYGWKVPTLGYGHTDSAGSPLYAENHKLRITEQTARLILSKDMDAVAKSILPHVKVKLDENQLGALVSFTFNLGLGSLLSSTLLRKLNKRDYAGAAAEFRKWNKAGRPLRPVSGLTRRRTAEAALFVEPV